MTRSVPPKCGGCGSDRLLMTSSGDHAVCRDCQRLQEPETRPEPAQQLCDNCAFRPGSPERSEPFSWMRMVEKHIEDGIPFYCHKGMRVELNDDGTASFIPADDAEARLKICAGWWVYLMAWRNKGHLPFPAGGLSDRIEEVG